MLQQPPDCCKLVSVDPGSDTIGIATFWFDPYSVEIKQISAYTLHVSRQLNSGWISHIHSDKYDRINQIYLHLNDYFKWIQPNIIACESPYISLRTPSAFQALTEVVLYVRQAVIDYSQWIDLDMIDPTSVKKAVGITGKVSSDKEIVRNAISRIQGLREKIVQNLDQLDEHSVDAIAVGLAKLQKLKPS